MRKLGTLSFYNPDASASKAPLPTLQEEIAKFNGRARSLLRDVEIEESGTLQVKTTRGAHLTAESLEEAYERHNEKQTAFQAAEYRRREKGEKKRD